MTDLTDATSPVLLERRGAVATVRFNRPDAMNSLDTSAKEALLAALQEVSEDAGVRAVVLTGAGRAFCVGQDLREHVEGLRAGDQLDATVVNHYNPAVTLVATMRKPVVAALNGVAAGAGASLAFAADFRILAEGAGFNLAFAGIALSCDTGASWSLPRLVGTAKAKELLLLGGTVSATEAQALGLATKVVAADEFDSAVGQFAERLAAGPTQAYGSIRQAVVYSAAHGLAESLANEAEHMAATGASQDHRNAVDAFLAKEKPSFEGH